MIVFDLEIVNAVPPSDAAARLAGVTYCEGWHDHAGMGIAVVCLYDYARDSYGVFGANELPDLQRIVDRTDVVVGFNSHSFDNRVLAANKVVVPANRSYDLLAEIYAATGTRYSLDALARVNGSTGKNGSGARAPILWQEGRVTEVVNYCLQDVRLTKHLLDKVIRCGAIYAPDKSIIRLPKPGSRTPTRF